MENRLDKARSGVSGFSLTELLIVLGIIAVMAVISLPYLVNVKKAYKSEDQALKVIDMMREANQLAIARRRTIRFEIDLTDNLALIIDENNTAPDRLVRQLPLEHPNELRMDMMPAGVSRPNPPNFNNLTAAADTRGHIRGSTSVSGHSVIIARFRSDGSVVSNTDVLLSGNLFVWPPISPGSTTPRNRNEIRAITLSGGSGAVRYWKHNGTTFVSHQ